MQPTSPLDDLLAGLPTHRRQLFEARLERWLPDLEAALVPLYADPAEVRDRLVRLAAAAFAARSEELHALDLRRSLAPDWFQRPEMIGYAAYADRFAGDLAGVADRAGYLEDLGVRYLHLMPLLTPRPAPNDGGYAVQDHRSVRPDLGTIEDLRALTGVLRARGISLCLDLVLNHVAREHEWARKAQAGDPTYRDYFLVFPDRSLPDAYERTLPEVFPDFAPGSFTWDDDVEGWVWTTFNHYQWDVNWANPDVLLEYAETILSLANDGVEVFRLDAIAFTWKRMGTDCQNQPEVHALTQALRTVSRIAAPATVFKAEAIVGPQDLLAYLGQGERHGKVSDLAYHNSLMVHVWSMLASRDATLAARALQRLATPPSTTAWVTYARCHDDIGWAIDDADAARAGVSGFSHRAFLSDFYTGAFPGSWGRGLVFQENPA
ncbi:MAG: ams, partial [Marmoricola sp.]|nr:ams [Marmoricola sp.]